MPIKISTYYKRAVLYPAVFVLIFCVAYAAFNNIGGGWQMARSSMLMSGITALIFVLLMSLLSLTIFLNKINALKRNMIWNALTFFLLPFLYIATVWIYDLQIRVKFGFGFGDDYYYLLLVTIPFAAGLVRSFMNFRQRAS